MLSFKTTEELVSYMFEQLDNEDNLVSVVAHKDIVVDILKEFFNYEDVILDACEIDYESEYDHEYIISLFKEPETNKFYINIEKCYLSQKEGYVSTDGYVLFHEDVNSKALIDMQNNEYAPLSEHDWFTFKNDEADEHEDLFDLDSKGNDKSDVTIKININADNIAYKEMRDEMVNIVSMMRYPFPMRFF